MVMTTLTRFVHHNQRMLKKTLSYYIMHITVAMLVAYVVTRNLWVALTLSMLEPTVQAFAFFIHEKVWAVKEQPAQQDSSAGY
jgi:uncharacterized membrane protein